MIEYVPPNIEECAHCGKQFNALLKIREESMLIVRTLARLDPDLIYILCAVCTLELGEFVEPKLKEDETWQQQKEAVIRIVQAAQN